MAAIPLIAELAHDRPRPLANPAVAVDARPRLAVRTAMTRTGEHVGREPGRLVLDGFPYLIVRIHIVPRAPRPPAAIVRSHVVSPCCAIEPVDHNTAVGAPNPSHMARRRPVTHAACCLEDAGQSGDAIQIGGLAHGFSIET